MKYLLIAILVKGTVVLTGNKTFDTWQECEQVRSEVLVNRPDIDYLACVKAEDDTE